MPAVLALLTAVLDFAAEAANLLARLEVQGGRGPREAELAGLNRRRLRVEAAWAAMLNDDPRDFTRSK